MAVHEILVFDQHFRDLVHNNASVSELRSYALTIGMTPLRTSAMELLKQGTTTLEEIVHISHGV